jgi:hypothetical protein
MFKSKSMMWEGNVARIGRRGTRKDYWWESQKERDYKEDQDVGRRIILRWILKR